MFVIVPSPVISCIHCPLATCVLFSADYSYIHHKLECLHCRRRELSEPSLTSCLSATAVRRISRLARNDLDLGSGHELATEESGLFKGQTTHDDPVPSMRNWGSFTTNVHTSSHRRYVDRCPCLSACVYPRERQLGVAMMPAVWMTGGEGLTLTDVFCLTPF